MRQPQPPSSSGGIPRVSDRSHEAAAAAPLSLLSKISDIATRFSERISAAQLGTRPPTYVLRDDCRNEQGRPQLEFQCGPLESTIQRRESRVITASATPTGATTSPPRSLQRLRGSRSATFDLQNIPRPRSPNHVATPAPIAETERDYLPSVGPGMRRSSSVGSSPASRSTTDAPRTTAVAAWTTGPVKQVRSWSPGHTSPPQSHQRELRSASVGAADAGLSRGSSAGCDHPPLPMTDGGDRTQTSQAHGRGGEAMPPTPFFSPRSARPWTDVNTGRESDACEKSLDERELEALNDTTLTKNIATRQDFKRELTRIRRLSFVTQSQWDDEIRHMREHLARLEYHRRRSSSFFDSEASHVTTLPTPAGAAEVHLFDSLMSPDERRQPSVPPLAPPPGRISESDPPTPASGDKQPSTPLAAPKTPQPRRRLSEGAQSHYRPYIDGQQWRTSTLLERRRSKTFQGTSESVAEDNDVVRD